MSQSNMIVIMFKVDWFDFIQLLDMVLSCLV